MKTKRLLLLGLTLCLLLEQTAVAQPAPASPPNADPARVRAIVQALANKSGAKAVLFGMWVHDREVLTMALGESIATLPGFGARVTNEAPGELTVAARDPEAEG